MFKAAIKSILVIPLLATHVACTSLQPISKNCDDGACTAGLAAGDEVVVNTRNQGTLTLQVQQANTEQLMGMTRDKPPAIVSVATNDIIGIQKRQFSAVRTTGAVVGTGFVVTAIMFSLVAVGLAHALIAL